MTIYQSSNYICEKITPSMLGVFVSCPRQFFYRYIENRPFEMEDTHWLKRGRVVQKILEIIVNKDNWDNYEKIIEDVVKEEKLDSFEDTKIKNLVEIILYFKDLRKTYLIKSEDWLKYGIKTDQFDFYVLGRIDFKLLDNETEKVVGIIDGKASAKRDRFLGRPYYMIDQSNTWTSPYINQLLFYALPFFETISFVGFLYWESLFLEKVLIDEFSKEKIMKDIGDLIQDAFGREKKEECYSAIGVYCRTCFYKNICKK